jgi:hypothetical protein
MNGFARQMPYVLIGLTILARLLFGTAEWVAAYLSKRTPAHSG